MLVNHFKSKGFGGQKESNAKRKLQAERVAKIVRRLKKEGEENVVVLGDLNDTPDSDPLSPLFSGTGLRDISSHPKFTDDGRGVAPQSAPGGVPRRNRAARSAPGRGGQGARPHA